MSLCLFTPDRSDNLLSPRTDRHADRIHITFSNCYYFIGNLTSIKWTHWTHFDFSLRRPVVALQSLRLNSSLLSSSALHTSSKGRMGRLLRPLFSSSINTAQTLAMCTLEGCVWKSHNKHQMLSWILSLGHYLAIFQGFFLNFIEVKFLYSCLCRDTFNLWCRSCQSLRSLVYFHER